MTFSPVKGPEGNIEYLIWLSIDSGAEDTVTDDTVLQVVDEAHDTLDK